MQSLGILKQKFPNIPVLALTATATASVKEDVVQALGLVNCVVFRQSFNRPNLLSVNLLKSKYIYIYIYSRVLLTKKFAGIPLFPRRKSAWKILTNLSRKTILMNVELYIVFQEMTARKLLKSYRLLFIY